MPTGRTVEEVMPMTTHRGRPDAGEHDEDAALWLSRRWDGLVPGAFLGALVAGVLSLDGHPRWAVAAAVVITLGGMLVSPTARLVLRDDTLVLTERRGETRIPLDEITRIHVTTELYAGEYLAIASRTRELRLPHPSGPTEFLLALGRALGDRADRRIVSSTREARLLGVDLRWGTHPAAGTRPAAGNAPAGDGDPGVTDC